MKRARRRKSFFLFQFCFFFFCFFICLQNIISTIRYAKKKKRNIYILNHVTFSARPNQFSSLSTINGKWEAIRMHMISGFCYFVISCFALLILSVFGVNNKNFNCTTDYRPLNSSKATHVSHFIYKTFIYIHVIRIDPNTIV